MTCNKEGVHLYNYYRRFIISNTFLPQILANKENEQQPAKQSNLESREETAIWVLGDLPEDDGTVEGKWTRDTRISSTGST